MKITILAIGTLGDVQPLVALGKGLQAEGHEVSVATHAAFETFILTNKLGFFLIEGNIKEAFQSEAGRAAYQGGWNFIKSWHNFARMIKQLIIHAGTDAWTACRDADAILFSPIGYLFGPHIAEKLNIPAMAAYFQPIHLTGAFPSFISPTQRNLGSIFNQFTHIVAELMYWLPYRSMINKWREECLNLPPIPLTVNYVKQMRRQRYPAIYGISPNVLPKPPDWGNNIEITGYWFLDSSEDWNAPKDLVDFLGSGPPPVYVGFGSTNTGKPKEITDLIIQALKLTNQRGVLSMGWGGFSQSDLPDNVFKAESIPHDWLFPQMATVIHHGGAGTTAAGLRAGIPSIIVPFFVDQPFWGQRVSELGVGPKPIPIKRLSIDRLAVAIMKAVSDKEIQMRAAMLGKKIRAEDGVNRAVEVINRHISSFT